MKVLPLSFFFLTIIFSLLIGGCKEKTNETKTETMNPSGTTQNKSVISFKADYASVNGLKMYYEIHGTGKPLVLIHGGGSTIYTTFGKVLPLLAKNHQVIAVELQAHGHTSDRNADETFEQDADDVAELLNQLHIDKADIFGFSNGANTSMRLATRHPEKVNKLILASGFYKRSGMPKEFWEFMTKGTFDNMPQVYKDEFLKIRNDKDALLAMYNRDAHRMVNFKDWNKEDISAIKAPTLVVAGDQDIMSPEHTVEIYRLLPHGKLAILPGTHGSYMGEIMSGDSAGKAPESFVMMVEEFLALSITENK